MSSPDVLLRLRAEVAERIVKTEELLAQMREVHQSLDRQIQAFSVPSSGDTNTDIATDVSMDTGSATDVSMDTGSATDVSMDTGSVTDVSISSSKRAASPEPSIPAKRKRGQGRVLGIAASAFAVDSVDHAPPAPERFQCPVTECNKGYSRKDNLMVHLRTGHPADHPEVQAAVGPKPFPCPVAECKRAYARKDFLAAHVRSEHPEVPAASVGVSAASVRPPKRYPCPVPACTNTYARKDRLAAHVRSEHPDVPAASVGVPAASVGVSATSVGVSAASVGASAASVGVSAASVGPPKRYPCPVPACTNAYARKVDLIVHLRSDHPADLPEVQAALAQLAPYPCPVPTCTNTYSRKVDLAAHLRSDHPADLPEVQAAVGPKPLACPVPGCHKSYLRKDMLAAHVRSEHPEVPAASVGVPAASVGVPATSVGVSAASVGPPKPFPCPVTECKRDYSTKGNLIVHLRSDHLGDLPEVQAALAQLAPYLCPVPACKRAYARKDNLAIHLRSEHPADLPEVQAALVELTKSKRCPCPVPACTNAYSRKVDLVNHLRSAHSDVEAKAANATLAAQESKRYPCPVKDCQFATRTSKELLKHLCDDALHLKNKAQVATELARRLCVSKPKEQGWSVETPPCEWIDAHGVCMSPSDYVSFDVIAQRDLHLLARSQAIDDLNRTRGSSLESRSRPVELADSDRAFLDAVRDSRTAFLDSDAGQGRLPRVHPAATVSTIPQVLPIVYRQRRHSQQTGTDADEDADEDEDDDEDEDEDDDEDEDEDDDEDEDEDDVEEDEEDEDVEEQEGARGEGRLPGRPEVGDVLGHTDQDIQELLQGDLPRATRLTEDVWREGSEPAIASTIDATAACDFNYIVGVADRYREEPALSKPKNVSGNGRKRFLFMLVSIGIALGREASIHKELLRLVQQFCLILAHVQHLERGEVLIPCIFPLIARLYGCGADHSVDTIGAMMVGVLGTALLWSKGGVNGSGTWEAWKGPMSCPAAIYGDPDAEAKLGRVICQAPGCDDRQLDIETGPRRCQGSKRAKQVSVESIRGRVPSEIGGLRRAVAAGGLLYSYECPFTWFAWTVHPGLVLIWRVFGRLTHVDCKVVRGHLLLRYYI